MAWRIFYLANRRAIPGANQQSVNFKRASLSLIRFTSQAKDKRNE